MRIVTIGVVGLLVALAGVALSDRPSAAARRVKPALKTAFAGNGLQWRANVFLRAFKEERELELWVEKGNRFELFRTYEIAALGRRLGPKMKEGDGMTPEGFYFFKEGALNPQSSYHLSFNIGYPNAYDRSLGRTGSLIMVHGSTVTAGCYAMTDAKIEEIYTLVNEAFRGGQSFIRFHSFPFRMTDERMARAKKSPHYAFWQNLKEGYDAFEETKNPPNTEVQGGRYVFKR